jgi:hypothetical protein
VQVNFQSLVGHNAMLLAAGLDDRKHVQSLSPASMGSAFCSQTLISGPAGTSFMRPFLDAGVIEAGGRGVKETWLVKASGTPIAPF